MCRGIPQPTELPAPARALPAHRDRFRVCRGFLTALRRRPVKPGHVVVMHVSFCLDVVKPVQNLLLRYHAERGNGEHLRLAAGKETAAVYLGQKPYLRREAGAGRRCRARPRACPLRTAMCELYIFAACKDTRLSWADVLRFLRQTGREPFRKPLRCQRLFCALSFESSADFISFIIANSFMLSNSSWSTSQDSNVNFSLPTSETMLLINATIF